MASYGHIVELEKKNMGIDINNGYEPAYLIDPDKKRVVAQLKAAAAKADKVWIATDEDREGEAIGRHVATALWLDIKTTPRITFHEITKPALEHAVAHPRHLDMDLINAQQARRVLDRLVGFELSPLLWKKVKFWLSAGRVQSVAVRLLVDREREINAFTPTVTLQAVASFTVSKSSFAAKNISELKKIDDAKAMLTHASAAAFTVTSVEAKPMTKSPSAPFTTSTLQQEASRRLWFSVSQTMRVAQKLYESGAITYMRTDSVNMSATAIAAATAEIKRCYDDKHVNARNWTTKKWTGAQEAHECIRPTNFAHDHVGGDNQEQKLYHLIRQRAIASQMANLVGEKTTVMIGQWEKYKRQAVGEVVTFPGWSAVYGIVAEDEDAESGNQGLPPLQKWQSLDLDQMQVMTAYDRYPARYTEASLVKKLESEGIGRPSTYAPTIATIMKRGYVILEDRAGVAKEHDVLTLTKSEKNKARSNSTQNTQLGTRNLAHDTILKDYGAERKKLFPTDIGMMVTDFLIEHFPKIVDYHFTANVETQFDKIADGGLDWKMMMDAFYKPFSVTIQAVAGTAERVSSERLIGVDPKSGKNLYAKMGKFWPYVQKGENDDTDKVYASLKAGLRLETVTVDQAIGCLALPRKLGLYDGQEMSASIGKFWPYIKRWSLFASIPKTSDPYTITADEAKALVIAKQQSNIDKHICSFVYRDIDTIVEKGRYGPYIKYGRENVRIPKELLPKIEKYTEKDWITLMDKIAPKQVVATKKAIPTKAPAKATAKAKAPAKKTVVKKKTTKKVAIVKKTIKKPSVKKAAK